MDMREKWHSGVAVQLCQQYDLTARLLCLRLGSNKKRLYASERPNVQQMSTSLVQDQHDLRPGGVETESKHGG